MFGSKESTQKVEESIKLTTHQPAQRLQDFSLIYSGETFHHRVGEQSLFPQDINRSG